MEVAFGSGSLRCLLDHWNAMHASFIVEPANIAIQATKCIRVSKDTSYGGLEVESLPRVINAKIKTCIKFTPRYMWFPPITQSLECTLMDNQTSAGVRSHPFLGPVATPLINTFLVNFHNWVLSLYCPRIISLNTNLLLSNYSLYTIIHPSLKSLQPNEQPSNAAPFLLIISADVTVFIFVCFGCFSGEGGWIRGGGDSSQKIARYLELTLVIHYLIFKLEKSRIHKILNACVVSYNTIIIVHLYKLFFIRESWYMESL